MGVGLGLVRPEPRVAPALGAACCPLKQEEELEEVEGEEEEQEMAEGEEGQAAEPAQPSAAREAVLGAAGAVGTILRSVLGGGRAQVTRGATPRCLGWAAVPRQRWLALLAALRSRSLSRLGSPSH